MKWRYAFDKLMDRLPYNTVFDVRLKTLCHVGPWTVSFAAEVTVDMY